MFLLLFPIFKRYSSFVGIVDGDKDELFFLFIFFLFFCLLFSFSEILLQKSVHVKCKCLHLRTDICPNRCVFTIKKASIELGSLRYQCIVLRRSRQDGFFVFSLFIFYQVYFTNISIFPFFPFLPLCS